ncbi:MAG: isochorismatase family protein [Clostridia bacterium]|nr:isochorismatase family protein [Clostridia bacterium]
MKLLVIDMQKGLAIDELYDFDGFMKKVVRLINKARKNNVEVIYFQHDAGAGTGLSAGDEAFEIADRVAPKESEKVYVKTINSCFGNADFVGYLKRSGEKELMIVGLQTDFCIDATIKSAFEKGYKVFVPSGANTTFDNPLLSADKACKYFSEWIWQGSFADCVSFAAALKLLEHN